MHWGVFKQTFISLRIIYFVHVLLDCNLFEINKFLFENASKHLNQKFYIAKQLTNKYVIIYTIKFTLYGRKYTLLYSVTVHNACNCENYAIDTNHTMAVNLYNVALAVIAL